MNIIDNLLTRCSENHRSNLDYLRNTALGVIVGSSTFGVNLPSSDIDIYTIFIPPVDALYPHLKGKVCGFDDMSDVALETYIKHHINFQLKQYDLTCYPITKFFRLAIASNPNLLEMLWVPQENILHTTPAGRLLIKNRHKFLSIECHSKFIGFSSKSLNSIRNSNRTDLIEKFGFDTKNAYHAVRLMFECNSLIATGDMNISANGEYLTKIRNGDIPIHEIEEVLAFYRAEILNNLAEGNSPLPVTVNEREIKELLLECIEANAV